MITIGVAVDSSDLSHQTVAVARRRWLRHLSLLLTLFHLAPAGHGVGREQAARALGDRGVAGTCARQ
jgi:hypothetical protein